MTPSVTENPELNRFEVHEDDQVAGFLEYREDGSGKRELTHTQVGEEFGGRGLASKLVRAALDDARAKNLAVVPSCSVVRHFLGKNPEYLETVDADARAELEAKSS